MLGFMRKKPTGVVGPPTSTPQPRRPRRRTLAALQQEFFVDVRAARELLENSAPDLTQLHLHSLVTPADIGRELRTDVLAEADGLTYTNFGPPALWEVPYSILRVFFFRAVDQKAFMYHAGEELLFPIQGTVKYHFFHTPGGRTPSKLELMPEELLKPGHGIRANCQIPHHGWLPIGYEPQGEAWMAFRHSSEVPTSISVDERVIGMVKPHFEPRRLTADEIVDQENPARYALIAWGLAEAIRQRRQASRLQITDVARVCGIDRSHLSRIERGETNVALSTLYRLAKLLHIDLIEQVRQSLWTHFSTKAMARDREDPAAVCVRRILCPQGLPHHMLHATVWDLLPATEICIDTRAPFSSWIVLEGSARAEWDSHGASASFDPIDAPQASARAVEMLDLGSVLHLRVRDRLSLLTTERARLLQIEYLQKCPEQPAHYEVVTPRQDSLSI